MKEIKFTFYEIDIELDENFFNWNIKEYFLNPLPIKECLLEINGYKAYLKKYNENIYIFQKFKKDFLPKIGDDEGNERNIELKENEYILEENVILIDFDNKILIFHKNNAGFNISHFQTYITELLKNKIKKFVLKPKLLTDTLEKLKNYNFIKSINFKLGQISVETLQKVGFDIEKIRTITDINSTNSIEIIIKAKRNHSILDANLLSDFLQNINFFDKLKVKASSSYEGSGEDIDLLDNILTINKKIKETNKRLDTLDLINKIQEVYNEYLPEIKGI